MASYAFPKSHRLLTSGDFQAVFADAPVRASHKHFLILARPNGESHSRLGLVIAKKHIRLATRRNRLKRLIRETFRHQQPTLGGIDVIVLARKGMDELDNRQLHDQLDGQWRRIARKAQKSTDTTPTG
ncbi:ribonuclease P protein component [Marinimicrobium sp. C2-29]|uniref:ribonuclease P protein component n=1 Tax=Marinimicrobium sp. C2-29 TaxID=3139825 RepID=UPI003139CB37